MSNKVIMGTVAVGILGLIIVTLYSIGEMQKARFETDPIKEKLAVTEASRQALIEQVSVLSNELEITKSKLEGAYFFAGDIGSMYKACKKAGIVLQKLYVFATPAVRDFYGDSPRQILKWGMDAARVIDVYNILEDREQEYKHVLDAIKAKGD